MKSQGEWTTKYSQSMVSLIAVSLPYYLILLPPNTNGMPA